jgi:hypothetical protein
MDNIIEYHIIPYVWNCLTLNLNKHVIEGLLNVHYRQVILLINKQWNRAMRTYLIKYPSVWCNAKVSYFDSPRGYFLTRATKLTGITKSFSEMVKAELKIKLKDKKQRLLYPSRPVQIDIYSISVSPDFLSDGVRITVFVDYVESKSKNYTSKRVGRIYFYFTRSFPKNENFYNQFRFYPNDDYFNGNIELIDIARRYLLSKEDLIMNSLIAALNVISYYKFYTTLLTWI